ncbi:agmatinase [Peptococcus simiae]|uniref:agmatinase n=1 Tax=Peptococcus simiae TaxID=1643805 RepID=UPI00397F4BD5
MTPLTLAQTTFIACDSAWEAARTVLFGAPFDGTTSFRPGTRFGPSAVRLDSDGLETYSPYQDKDLEDYAIFDSGDLDLPFGDTEAVLKAIEDRTRTILAAGKRPFMIGGEHLVTLGSMRAVAQVYPDVEVLHFDAHADLREDYLGVALSHATVMRRVADLIGADRLHQFGIRSGTREEFAFARAHTDFHPFAVTAVAACAQALQGKPVYLSVDMDVLDPSVFPGTGTPEAGGISWRDLLGALLQLRGLNIIGMDVNELSPHYDPSGVSTAVYGKTIREMLLLVESNK